MQTPTEILIETARLFAVVAQSRYTHGGVEIETQGDTTAMRAHLPINPSKVTAFYVWIDAEKVDVRVYGSFASDDVEASGFGQTSAKKMLSTNGLTAEKLAKTIASLGNKARA